MDETERLRKRVAELEDGLARTLPELQQAFDELIELNMRLYAALVAARSALGVESPLLP